MVKPFSASSSSITGVQSPVYFSGFSYRAVQPHGREKSLHLLISSLYARVRLDTEGQTEEDRCSIHRASMNLGVLICMAFSIFSFFHIRITQRRSIKIRGRCASSRDFALSFCDSWNEVFFFNVSVCIYVYIYTGERVTLPSSGDQFVVPPVFNIFASVECVCMSIQIHVYNCTFYATAESKFSFIDTRL